MRISMITELQRSVSENGLVDFEATYAESLEQARLADKAGFHAIWITEHHFLPTFSVAPASDQFLAAVAAQTKNIRVGTGVVVLPYHHPVHVAERIAMLDLISEGRVEFGTGRGGVYEVTGHSIDPRDTREMWEESLACIEGIWESYPEEFSFEGKYWQVPPRVVVPQPVQKPPGRWLACAQPASFEVAADYGIGVLSFVPSPPSVTANLIKDYRERIARCDVADTLRNENWASMAFAVCGDDGHAARQLVSKALKVFFGPDRPYNAAAAAITKTLIEEWGGEVPEDLKVHMAKDNATGSINAAEVKTGTGLSAAARALHSDTELSEAAAAATDGGEGDAWDRLDPETLADSGITIAGEPEQCIEALQLYEENGVDEVMVLVQNETVPHQVSMETIRQFGEHVIPHFQ